MALEGSDLSPKEVDERPFDNPREAPGGYLSVLLGAFWGEETSERLERWTKYSPPSSFEHWAPNWWEINAGYYVLPFLALEGAVSIFSRDYSLPSAPEESDRIRLNTIGLSASAKASYPIRRFRPFAGAGLGLFDTGLHKESPNSSDRFSVGSSDSKTSLGYQFMSGIDLMISQKFSLGIEYRRVFLKTDFGDLTNGVKDIGGDMAAIAIRYNFDKWKQ